MAGAGISLSFDLASSQRGPDGVVTVQFGSLNRTIDLPSSTGFTLETFSVTITDPGGDVISIASGVPGNIGALLDNVAVTTGATPAPEPASLALLGVALLGTGLARRRAG